MASSTSRWPREAERIRELAPKIANESLDNPVRG